VVRSDLGFAWIVETCELPEGVSPGQGEVIVDGPRETAVNNVAGEAAAVENGIDCWR